MRKTTLRGNTYEEVLAQFHDAFAALARAQGTTADVAGLAHELRAQNVARGRPAGDGADVIMADPPWRYAQEATDAAGNKRAVSAALQGCTPYETMTTAQLCAMDVAALSGAAPTALLMWATAPKLNDALAVMRAWGFTYCTVFLVWVKRNRTNKPILGVGAHTRSNAEFMLVGRRGSIGHLYDQNLRGVTSQILDTNSGRPRHSEKPPEARRLVERLFPDTLRAELFTRHRHSGWTGFGDQAGTLGGNATQPTLAQLWKA